MRGICSEVEIARFASVNRIFLPLFRYTAALLLGGVPALGQRPLGADVSGYQPASINWSPATNAGVKFAWSKATEGTGYINPNFASQVAGAVAAKVLEARANDGHDAVDAYRPRTTPGAYVPTAITAASMWPNVKPFAIANPSPPPTKLN